MQRPAVLSFSFLMAGIGVLPAQVSIRAPNGVLSGTVLDSMTGQPVGYALIVQVERNQRIFASEAGRFTLTGLGPGRLTLRVQQIGYQGISLPLLVDPGEAEPRGPGFTVRMVRQALVLPPVVVQAEACAGLGGSGQESGTVMDEAFKNAERMLTLARDYPYRASLRHATTVLNADRVALHRKVDTIQFESRSRPEYRRGRVLAVRTASELGRITLREYANYFDASDLAREEFRRYHCFWFAGRDSVSGFPAYRIEFRPVGSVSETDWAGALFIDSASMHLLRSEASLVNLPKVGAPFLAARCSALYVQLAPTLIHEFQAHCVTAHNVRPAAFTDERWNLVDRAVFTGRRPDAPMPP